jgi:hypothetical protein
MDTSLPIGLISDLSDLVWLVKSFGPLIVACVFFVWRDYRREERLNLRIDQLEDEQRKVILPLVRECSEVIAKNTAVMERLERSLDRQNGKTPPKP